MSVADGNEVSLVEVVIDEEQAARIEEVRALLAHPCAASPAPPQQSLETLLARTGAPLAAVADAASGRKLVTTRAIAEGEVLFVEEATAIFLCRSPGAETVYSMCLSPGGPEEQRPAVDVAQQRLLCTLPPWSRMRTLRDTLTFAPRFAGRAEEAFTLLAQLTALGSAEHTQWDAVAAVPPGAVSSAELAETGGDAAAHGVPPRAQLLQAISQCNGFVVALPAEDSDWRRGLLWPLLGRVALASDRERLFDDPEPLSCVTGLFVLAALFNHACGAASNVSYAACSWEEGDAFPFVTLRAARAIAAGDECTIGYLGAADDALPGAARRYKLLMTYRFRCACASCHAELPALDLVGTGAGAVDPLRAHFVCGAGPESVRAFFAMGGRYPTRKGEGEGEGVAAVGAKASASEAGENCRRPTKSAI